MPANFCNRLFLAVWANICIKKAAQWPLFYYRYNYNMYRVLKNEELPSSTISLKRCLLASFIFVATSERMENERKASVTDKVPSALSLRPVNGNTSGPRWHWALIFTRLTSVTNGSISDDTSSASLLKILTCMPCGESIW